jgi:hypothetical protein
MYRSALTGSACNTLPSHNMPSSIAAVAVLLLLYALTAHLLWLAHVSSVIQTAATQTLNQHQIFELELLL